MSEVVDPHVILQRIEQMERELEELRVTVLKVEVLSADEAIKILSEKIES